MLADLRVIALADRGVVRVGGADRVGFLQGLVSNDVLKVGEDRAVYAALLTPQGKFLHDFFIVERHGAFELDCEAARADDLCSRLSRFRLRAQVEIANVTPARFVAAVIDEASLATLGLDRRPAGTVTPFAGGVAYLDPRLREAGARLLLPRDNPQPALIAAAEAGADAAAYDRHRLALGLPDGSRDMEVDKAVLLECGFDELSGVDWHKGCYLGQELTARTKYRGLVKKRLVPVSVDGGAVPPPGTPIVAGDRDVGVMRSGRDGRALALLRLEALGEDSHLSAAGVRVVPTPSAWMKMP